MSPRKPRASDPARGATAGFVGHLRSTNSGMRVATESRSFLAWSSGIFFSASAFAIASFAAGLRGVRGDGRGCGRRGVRCEGGEGDGPEKTEAGDAGPDRETYLAVDEAHLIPTSWVGSHLVYRRCNAEDSPRHTVPVPDEQVLTAR